MVFIHSKRLEAAFYPIAVFVNTIPVLVAAGLPRRRRSRSGLQGKPWVKSSLAPGSKVVTEYYDHAGLTPVPRGARLPHGGLRLHDLHRQLGPLAQPISRAAATATLVVCSVLSGNRNFEARVHPR